MLVGVPHPVKLLQIPVVLYLQIAHTSVDTFKVFISNNLAIEIILLMTILVILFHLHMFTMKSNFVLLTKIGFGLFLLPTYFQKVPFENYLKIHQLQISTSKWKKIKHFFKTVVNLVALLFQSSFNTYQFLK